MGKTKTYTNVFWDILVKDQIPLWREKPEDYFGSADVDTFQEYFNGFCSGSYNCFDDKERLYYGLSFRDYQLTIGTGPYWISEYLKMKHKGDFARAFYEYLDHLEIFISEYSKTHQTICRFKKTYSTDSFRKGVSRWLRGNPELGVKHLVLSGGNFNLVPPYMYVHTYSGFAIKCPLDPDNSYEASCIRGTESILKELGLSS